ncbi:unnamed protein product (macronuclear) [Paramecium tetraurelia]|uniref:AP180 N-terminal homology (ANTH) domain-containing protein n=1 Tax=Paramecium tetraurelia TaxID=5888 RepID=A0CU19_PARTE|nr:uncharacterized protein GSPATT00010485001 [Paramecium tetraurelia]CAK74286.1 unnamed protein product [Paramecium tetraurelia]|eukprot:XP_001441683.1 hypothetical protein (macronuclear) [Paramecium tetraurelia strain d4-2]
MFNMFFKQQTEFEKALSNSSILNNKPSLSIADLKHLIQGFPQQSQSMCRTPQSIKKTFQTFFQALPEKTSFRVKLKVLATCHVLLEDGIHGQQFSESLLSWNGFRIKQNNISNIGFRDKNQDQEKFVQMYQEMLKRFAYGFDLLRIAKSQQINSSNTTIDCTYYYKAINLLNHIFSYSQFIKYVFETVQELIVGEILLLIWNDVIATYLFIEKIIFQFLVDYQIIQASIFFQLNGLIPEFIRLTSQIQKFYESNQNFLNLKQFKAPAWKIIDQKLLQDLEKQNQTLKLQNAKDRLTKKQSSKASSLSTLYSTPQHQTAKSFLFGNTTFGYIKRLSTLNDPFDDIEEMTQGFKI